MLTPEQQKEIEAVLKRLSISDRRIAILHQRLPELFKRVDALEAKTS